MCWARCSPALVAPRKATYPAEMLVEGLIAGIEVVYSRYCAYSLIEHCGNKLEDGSREARLRRNIGTDVAQKLKSTTFVKLTRGMVSDLEPLRFDEYFGADSLGACSWRMGR
jgi:hypothetical protein